MATRYLTLMSDMEQHALELEIEVDAALAILRHHGVAHWPLSLENVLPMIRRRDAIGLERLLAMYGVMGSLNDVIVSRFNGHQISDFEEEAVNKALRSSLDRAFVLARDLLQEVR